jgi:hypothetical protein
MHVSNFIQKREFEISSIALDYDEVSINGVTPFDLLKICPFVFIFLGSFNPSILAELEYNIRRGTM